MVVEIVEEPGEVAATCTCCGVAGPFPRARVWAAAWKLRNECHREAKRWKGEHVCLAGAHEGLWDSHVRTQWGRGYRLLSRADESMRSGGMGQ